MKSVFNLACVSCAESRLSPGAWEKSTRLSRSALWILFSALWLTTTAEIADGQGVEAALDPVVGGLDRPVAGGSLTLRAGEVVALRSGTSVGPGGTLAVEIDHVLTIR